MLARALAGIFSPGMTNSSVNGGWQSNSILYEYYVRNNLHEERIIPWYECLNGFHALDGKCEINASKHG